MTQTDVDGRPGKDNGASRSVHLLDLTRDFGSFRALDGFDLRMAPGELVALLGPSGCGKTTVLRILAGLDHPTTGHVEVGGRDITRVPANKRDMGMVFQAYSLFPHLTVLDNVAFGLKLRGQDRSARRRRASEVLDLVGLGEHTAKYANQLSGGQQQRVALARALAIEPSVLLLDEPLSALDAKVRVQLRDEIRRVQLEVGTTTLFVTHDQEEALAVADRVGVMNRGRLEQLAPPSELYANPASQFVAEFVGLNNKVAAVVSDRRATVLGAAVPTIEGSISSGPGQALVRPESVTITADGPANATVASVNFLGPVSRVYVDVDDAELLMAAVPSPLAVRLNPGDRVAVGMERDAAAGRGHAEPAIRRDGLGDPDVLADQLGLHRGDVHVLQRPVPADGHRGRHARALAGDGAAGHVPGRRVGDAVPSGGTPGHDQVADRLRKQRPVRDL